MFQRYFEHFFVHTPARIILLPVEIFSPSVFVILKYQQAQPCIMTHGLHINQCFIHAELLYVSFAMGFCHAMLEAVCFTSFKPIVKMTASS